MNNKKGFTMVELMAVIAILAVVATITVPNVIGVLNKSSDKLNAEQKLAVENAAREFGIKNVYLEGNAISYDCSYPKAAYNELYDPDKTEDPVVINQSGAKYITLDYLQNCNGGFLKRKSFSNLKLSEEGLKKSGVCLKFENNQVKYSFTDDVSRC